MKKTRVGPIVVTRGMQPTPFGPSEQYTIRHDCDGGGPLVLVPKEAEQRMRALDLALGDAPEPWLVDLADKDNGEIGIFALDMCATPDWQAQDLGDLIPALIRDWQFRRRWTPEAP